MSAFTGDLAVRFVDDGRRAVLLEPLIWEVDEKGSGRTVTVPANFKSDGATIPRPLWWFLPPWGSRETRAAILHDYLVVCLAAGYEVAGLATRKDADWQLYLGLCALGISKVRAGAIYAAVRLYVGWEMLSR